MKSFIVAFTLIVTLSLSSCSEGHQNPNIIIIYTDDLGYGDVSAYGATDINKIQNKALGFDEGDMQMPPTSDVLTAAGEDEKNKKLAEIEKQKKTIQSLSTK